MENKAIFSNEWVRYVLILIGGITIGALFYPSKRIEEQISSRYESEISSLKESHNRLIERTKEEYTSSLKESSVRLEESQKKIVSLTTQVRDLKSKQKTAKYKIVRPDGTIEEKEFTETETQESNKVITEIKEEFNIKITQVEQKWSDIHKQRVIELSKEFTLKEAQYKKTIASLQASKVISINEKKFSIEGGYSTNDSYYGHASMDIWGPTFIGIHGEINKNNNNNYLGIGLGLRF